MGLLTRDAILATQDLPFEDVEVPEWGGTVRLRIMTGTERDAFELSTSATNSEDKKRNYENLRARLVALTAIGEDGTRLFSDEDVAELGRKSSAALDRCFEVATRLNALGKKEVEALGKS